MKDLLAKKRSAPSIANTRGDGADRERSGPPSPHGRTSDDLPVHAHQLRTIFGARRPSASGTIVEAEPFPRGAQSPPTSSRSIFGPEIGVKKSSVANHRALHARGAGRAARSPRVVNFAPAADRPVHVRGAGARLPRPRRRGRPDRADPKTVPNGGQAVLTATAR